MISDTCEGLDGGGYWACIIGSGPIGTTLALELGRRGKRVLLLESGGLRPERTTQTLSDADFADPELHDDMSDAVARRLGGTSNLWGGRCPPFDAVDFLPRPQLSEARWPITLADVQPFYAPACRYLSCGEPVFEAPDPSLARADGAFSATALERWSNTRPVQKTNAAELAASGLVDVRLHATVVGIDFAESGHATAVTVARPDGSRRQIPVQRLVIAAGGLETTRLLLAAQRTSPDRFGGPDGPLGRYYMGHVIGEIADVTFADDAIDAAFDFFIDRHGSYVRRRFIPSRETQLEHGLANTALFPVVPTPADSRHGNAILSMVCLVMSVPPLGRMLVAEAIRQRHVPPGLERWPHLVNLVRDLPGAAAYAPRFLWHRYGATIRHPAFYLRNRARRYGLSYHAEHLPNPDSRVRLSSRTDALGLPRLHIDLRFSDADIQSVVRTHDLLAAWLKRNRLGEVEYRMPLDQRASAVREQAWHGTHQIGTARMAASRSEGIVDRDLSCFDAPNLYLASSAVFPTSGQANPTLTMAALAVRLARHLVA